MLPTIFTEKASKTIVSCEASSKFHSTSFQNDRFVRGFLEISKNKLPKRSFRARLPPNFIEQSFQNERFARCFLEISQHKLPKRSFRARLPRNFKEQASKKIVSCEAILRNFTAQARKTSVSRDASDHFHRTILQNERFVRGFLEISQHKLPKRSFRARLPRNFTEQSSKTSVSCEASSKFHRTKLPKRTFRAMLPTISIENLRFATVSCHRPTESYERVRPAKAKCASRYNGVPFHISKSTFYYSGVRKNV